MAFASYAKAPSNPSKFILAGQRRQQLAEYTGSKSAQEPLHFGVIASHHKQKAIGAVLENQPDLQSHADFKNVSRQLANAQSLMAMRMAEIPFQVLQRQSNFAAGHFGISADAREERPA